MSFVSSQGSLMGGGRGNTEPFPDPFSDYSSLAMPESLPMALRWAEFLFMRNGTYREACRRLVAYFITDVELSDASSDVKDNWKKFLDETLDIKNVLHIVGLDLACYGNSFTSVIPTFTRYILCPKCRMIEKPLRQVFDEPVFNFRWEGFQFCAKCPSCSYSGPWKTYDRPTGEHSGFRIKRWSPHDIELLHDDWTGENRYIWKIPEDYRREIRKGTPHTIESAPMQVINAVKNGNHLLFEKDFVHHMREDALAGVINRGWGISRVLSNFQQAWYVQVLHRYNEAIALDYVIPFRLITPVPGDKSTGADVLVGQNAGGYMGKIHAMLQRRRRDPAGWNTLPFPVQYQAMGGDAKSLAPDTMLNQGLETLLNNIGIPAEMYRASLTLQAAPTALRLFEASNSSLPHNFNGFLRFVVRATSRLLRWDDVTARLMRVSHADDANRQLSKLQLATGGAISQSTGLRAVGVEYKDEVRQMMEDQRFQAEEQAKLQEQMDQKAQMQEMMQPPQQGQPGQPGQPAPGGGAQPQPGQPGAAPQSILAGLPQGPNKSVTPEELQSRAQYLASQLMGMPEAQKDSELIKLKKMDPTLHAQVKAQIESIRQQARTQGGAQVLAQQFGKAGVDLGEASGLEKKAAEVARILEKRRKVTL